MKYEGGSMRLGDYIKSLRLKKGLTQQKLAKMLNVNSRMIGFYEHHKFLPKKETLEKMADLFGSTPEEKEEIRDKLFELYNKEVERRKEKIPKIERRLSETEINACTVFTKMVLQDMKRKNLTSKEVSILAGIPMDRLNRILISEELPTREEVERIAEVLDQPPGKYGIVLSLINEEYASCLARDKIVKNFLLSYYQATGRKKEIADALLQAMLEILSREEE